MKFRSSLRRACWHLLMLALAAALPVDPAWAGGTVASDLAVETPFLGGFLRETRIVYPEVHQEWRALGEKRYDDQALGVSIRYGRDDRPGQWIDVFFYPAGVLTAAQFASVLGMERAQLQAAVGPGGYSELSLGDERPFEVDRPSRDGSPGQVGGYSMDLRSVLRGQALSSAMTLQLRDLYFVKGRMSVPADQASREDVQGQLRAFMASLVPAVVIRSSGACWRPVPAAAEPERRSDAPTGAPGSLAADADAPATVPSETTVVAGCEAPDALDTPAVPDGKRELRMEYLPPVAPDEAGILLGARAQPGRRAPASLGIPIFAFSAR